MPLMTAVAWVGVLLLVAMMVRAKIRFIGGAMVPACVIAGVIGFALMNTLGLPRVAYGEFNLISSQLYTFLFINMGLTVAAESGAPRQREKIKSLADLRGRVGDSMLSGILGMGSFWALAYVFQALTGYGVLKLIGAYYDMDPIYGTLLSFAFAQGPGQAIIYGGQMEASGWTHAVQVGLAFASVGFLVAFIVGVPFAKRGIERGLATSKIRLGDDVARGFIAVERQESYGKITTYSGAIDTLTFHVALVGLCWILGLGIGEIWALIPGYFGQLFSQLLFFNGMLAGYGVKYVLGRIGMARYLDRGTQNRITGLCTDLMVCGAFMAINLEIVGKWIVPIATLCVVCTAITWVTIRYFGARFGGSNDFERTLGEWGTATGTNATGISLIRIVDPENETTSVAELGPANIVNVPASYFVMPAILGFAAGTITENAMVLCLAAVLVGYLVFMRLVGVWGKKTYSMRKGEKYRNGAVYMRRGEPVDE